MTHGTGNTSDKDSKTPQVVDFTEVREKKLEEKRRTTERIFFKHLLSVYSVAENSKMRPIELVDVSEEGCSFQIPFDAENPWPTDTHNMSLRLYFSQDTYLEVQVKIMNSRPSIENGARYVRFGCAVDKATASYAAFQQFVKFLALYSEHAHKDMGNVTVFYL